MMPPLTREFDKSALETLDERSRDIFRLIVESYMASGDPVGSRNLSRKLPITLSPASVRNVMQDLEQLGLIYAPHVSAGRLPTEVGLRFFIDSLLQVSELTQEDIKKIEDFGRNRGASALSGAGGAPTEIGNLLAQTSVLISGLTHGAGVVATTKDDRRLRQIEFVRVGDDRALAVLVSEDGSVENRILPIPSDLPQRALVEAGNYLNARIRGRLLQDVRADLIEGKAKAEAELDELTTRLVEAGLAVWAGLEGQKRQLIVRGQANLLEDLSAREDLERIRLLFEDLETKSDVIDLLSRAEHGEGVRIFIGSENKLFSLSGSSMIVAPFHDQEKRVVGVLGVIGPTRLNYARIVPLIDYTAKTIAKIVGSPLSGV